MKKNDLIKVIREIVRQEIKKELPNTLAQVFSNLMGGQQPVVHSINTVRPIAPAPIQASKPEDEEGEVDETLALKQQLREMFSGGSPVSRARQQPPQQIQQVQERPKVQFTKNPVLNEILNQTRPFNSQERMAMRVGGGGGYSGMPPAVAMAAGSIGMGASMEQSAVVGAGEMMKEEELNFMKNVPGMLGADAPVVAEIPVGRRQVLAEGQEGGPAPMESLGEVSALDVKNHPALPDSIKSVLNRDFRSLVKNFNRDRNK